MTRRDIIDLGGTFEKPAQTDVVAPYGYKADGTPKKTRGKQAVNGKKVPVKVQIEPIDAQEMQRAIAEGRFKNPSEFIRDRLKIARQYKPYSMP